MLAYWVTIMRISACKTEWQKLQKCHGFNECSLVASIARVKEEVADMQAVATKNGDKITIEPWDYRYTLKKLEK